MSAEELIKQTNDLVNGIKSKLGNNYFYPTGTKCLNADSSALVDRSIYIFNERGESGPLSGNKFGQFSALVSSINVDINEINPEKINQAFNIDNEPKCRPISMNVDGNLQSAYIADIDIQTMNPCLFPDKKNPLTETTCIEPFSNIKKEIVNYMPDDPYMRAYLYSLGLLGFYIIAKIITKPK